MMNGYEYTDMDAIQMCIRDRGNSGDKGTVSVSGVATANNALAGGGAFAISYPVTLPQLNAKQL